jgi:hypothetical protein
LKAGGIKKTVKIFESKQNYFITDPTKVILYVIIP